MQDQAVGEKTPDKADENQAAATDTAHELGEPLAQLDSNPVLSSRMCRAANTRRK